MWEQLEFNFEFEKPKPARKIVDYNELYNRLKQGPISFAQIQEITGRSKAGASQVITTLTLKYPVWSPARGIYKLCEDSDYQTIDRSKLDVE